MGVKRPRPVLTCQFCQRRKIKCDKGFPCSSCVKYNSSNCGYCSNEEYYRRREARRGRRSKSGDWDGGSLGHSPSHSGGNYSGGNFSGGNYSEGVEFKTDKNHGEALGLLDLFNYFNPPQSIGSKSRGSPSCVSSSGSGSSSGFNSGSSSGFNSGSNSGSNSNSIGSSNIENFFEEEMGHGSSEMQLSEEPSASSDNGPESTEMELCGSTEMTDSSDFPRVNSILEIVPEFPKFWDFSFDNVSSLNSQGLDFSDEPTADIELENYEIILSEQYDPIYIDTHVKRRYLGPLGWNGIIKTDPFICKLYHSLYYELGNDEKINLVARLPTPDPPTGIYAEPGECSNLFFSKIQENEGQSRGGFQPFQFNNTNPLDILETMDLPPKSVILQFVRAFFKTVHPYIPLFDEVEFIELVEVFFFKFEHRLRVRRSSNNTQKPQKPHNEQNEPHNQQNQPYNETNHSNNEKNHQINSQQNTKLPLNDDNLIFLGQLLLILRITFISLFHPHESQENHQLYHQLKAYDIGFQYFKLAEICVNQFNLLSITSINLFKLVLLIKFYHFYGGEYGEGPDLGDQQSFNSLLVCSGHNLGLSYDYQQIWQYILTMDARSYLIIGDGNNISKYNVSKGLNILVDLVIDLNSHCQNFKAIKINDMNTIINKYTDLIKLEAMDKHSITEFLANKLQLCLFKLSMFFHYFVYFNKQGNSKDLTNKYMVKMVRLIYTNILPIYIRVFIRQDLVVEPFILYPILQKLVHRICLFNLSLNIRLGLVGNHDLSLGLYKLSKHFISFLYLLSKTYYYSWRIGRIQTYFIEYTKVVDNDEVYRELREFDLELGDDDVEVIRGILVNALESIDTGGKRT